MDCQYANNCPTNGGHSLPMTGLELSLFVGIALIILCAAVYLRIYAERNR